MTIIIPPKHVRDREAAWRDFCMNAEDYVAEATRRIQKEERRLASTDCPTCSKMGFSCPTCQTWYGVRR